VEASRQANEFRHTIVAKRRKMSKTGKFKINTSEWFEEFQPSIASKIFIIIKTRFTPTASKASDIGKTEDR
jgi:hypothetical protein